MGAIANSRLLGVSYALDSVFKRPSDVHPRYLTMATLSLYLFNLLPLPYLDGTELLRANLDMLFEGKTEAAVYDVESLVDGGHAREDVRTRKRLAERIMRVTHYGLGGALLCYILIAIINSLS